ncbi:hypothetical protein C823_007784 [Eubacterium plexicaudatum ASF492]|uniref:Uncharacterized protein n=1 Tax=Eubacterium plexicaudatum ASF492 TaxID=1235802 RepID=N2A4W6_9FIRM|nr:hypothetical protein C823_007784 [Eubacterium plexicaudatum ASF492]
MKRQIRRGVFETNSSSTHSLTMCSEEEFEAWKRGEVLFHEYGEENFISATKLSEHDKKMAQEDYEENKDDFQKDWNDLSEDTKQKYYTKYAKENDIIDEDAKTYDQYMHDGDLETFVQRYTSKNGDKIVAFGEYGYC